tara:strand:- start:2270 stop:3580 length:1311 start_codon:yes stop_codon:yes gene_type:complete
MATATQHNLEIVPSNVTSNGSISYRNGNPVIQFILGEQDAMLLGNSVRFTGQFRCHLSNTSDSSSDVSPLAMSEKLGIYSTIDTLTIKSQKTGQTIETIRHYNRFLASYLPVTSSKQDNMGHLYTSALILPNYAAQTEAVVNIPSQDTTGNHFCCALPCGLFNGRNPIPLMQEAVGGLLIEIHLAPDQQVFHSNTDSSASITDAFYEFQDVSLVCETIEPDPQTLQGLKSQPSGTFEYNSINSYYQTINSANGIINFQLGLSKVLGCFANIVPAAHINNYLFDGLATLYPTNEDGSSADIKELFFTRNGSKFPLDFNVNTIQQDDLTNPTIDPQLVYYYMDALVKFADIKRTSLNQVNVRYSNATRFDKDFADGGCGFGVGVAFDRISDQGVDFKNVNFGMNMSLELTTDSPQAFYLFVHNKNTLVFGPGGLQVLT